MNAFDKINYHFLKVKDVLLFRVDFSQIMQLVLYNVLYHFMYVIMDYGHKMAKSLILCDANSNPK